MLSGIKTTSAQNLQLGAGIVVTAYTPGQAVSADSILGATKGGGSFTAVPTLRPIEADGLNPNVKGWHYIDYWTATLNVTLIETSEAAIKLAMAGATASTSTSITTITAVQGLLASTAYADLWWVGDTSDGKKIAIKLSNALNTSGFNLNFVDKGEGSFALTATANYDPTALATIPFTVYLDKV